MKYEEQSIEQLVAKLPEIYQPIFGHPKFTVQASRACFDRFEKISVIYDFISKEKGRPLKVLDLGCAQGFFSFSLAERGAIVTAVDYSQPNINVCNKLAQENNQFSIKFILGSIELIIKEQIQTDEYDLVLGLSVFHHIIYEHGSGYVFELFDELSGKVENGIFEFALNSEPLYWANSQPKQPRGLLNKFSFIHQLSSYATHLSAIERPLYFASNKYWYIDQKFGIIDRFTEHSHAYESNFHKGSRRYYFSDNKLIKVFVAESKEDNNANELKKESVFLNENIEGLKVAKLIGYGVSGNEHWLIRELISGELLLDVILNGKKYNDEKVIIDILEQLAILESNGLFHNDLRPWNVLIGDDSKTYLIDYGSIDNVTIDGDDLYGQMLSFFVLIKEIAQHKLSEKGSQRPPFIAPSDFPEKYRKWINKIWSMPSQKWSFNNVYEVYLNNDGIDSEVPVSAILEGYLSIACNHMDWQFKSIQSLFFKTIESFDKDMSTYYSEMNKSVLNSEIKSEEQGQRLLESIDRIKEQFNEILFNNRIKYQEAILQLSEKMDAAQEHTSEFSQDLIHSINKHYVLLNKSLEDNETNHQKLIKQLSQKVDNIQHQTNQLLDKSFLKEINLNHENELQLKDEIYRQTQLAGHFQHELNMVYKSKSWRITYPLRLLSKSLAFFNPKKLKLLIKIRINRVFIMLISFLQNFVLNHHWLRQRIILFLNRYPALKHKIKSNLPEKRRQIEFSDAIVESIPLDKHIENTNQEFFQTPRKIGVGEKKKSVLEAWFY